MEKEFLLKLGKAYQMYDVSIIEDYLADDMHYASMWVLHEMTSKREYLEYLTGKLITLKRVGVHMDFEIVQGGLHQNALLVTNQKTPEGGSFGFVVDFNKDGKVKMINITASCFF